MVRYRAGIYIFSRPLSIGMARRWISCTPRPVLLWCWGGRSFWSRYCRRSYGSMYSGRDWYFRCKCRSHARAMGISSWSFGPIGCFRSIMAFSLAALSNRRRLWCQCNTASKAGLWRLEWSWCPYQFQHQIHA